jgi:hypothetical protein
MTITAVLRSTPRRGLAFLDRIDFPLLPQKIVQLTAERIFQPGYELSDFLFCSAPSNGS